MAKASLKQLNKQLSKNETAETNSFISENNKLIPEIQANVPRGERSKFLKITITIPADMLSVLKNIGMKRKANGQLDSDTSSLIREAVARFISENSN
jgi:hypothetical protein